MRTMLVAAAVAALGGGALVLTPSAEAGATVSQFVGEYTGQAVEPFESWQTVWGSISISTSGKIAGTKPNGSNGTGKFSGTVAADGTFSLSGSTTWHWPHNGGFWVRDGRPAGAGGDAEAAKGSAIATTYPFQSSGTLALGADGNLYGTTTSGATFVWTRK